LANDGSADMRLLLVEDNQQLAQLIQEGLSSQGFVIDRCGSLKEALATRPAANYELILLDLGLPDGDGMDWVRRLRQANDSTPILILTARGGLNDRLTGLDGGADDYLIKPFEIAELAARCRALLRRPGASLGVILQLGNVALDTTTRTVSVADRRIDFPPREVALLEQLLRRAEQVVRRGQLEESLYSFGEDVTPNALESAVSRLRKRLSSAEANVIVRTAHGIGYAIFHQP
jgi:DNA-binding response OmpR family regulator